MDPSLENLSSFDGLTTTNLRVDGQPMKKRGPKPRNAPALTRRQELARKAQRTHRERKELYVKALEQEVLQQKNDIAVLSASYESLEKENRQMNDNASALLRRNIALEEEIRQFRQLLGEQCTQSTVIDAIAEPTNPVPHGADPQLISSPTVRVRVSNINTNSSSVQASEQDLMEEAMQHELDYDQIGIEFVLSIERPCLGHMHVSPDGELYGHTLMASCVPGVYPKLDSGEPYSSPSDSSSADQSCVLSKSGLSSLLRRSQSLNLDGEVTPVMVWNMILNHPQFSRFTLEDFEKITKDLAAKVKCYGFGAIFEEFEVHDIIENILLSKSRSDTA